jgi:hypothetical protein
MNDVATRSVRRAKASAGGGLAEFRSPALRSGVAPLRKAPASEIARGEI